jgi:MarR family transcriptional regulator, organic hydroperoxide resistance regulator
MDPSSNTPLHILLHKLMHLYFTDTYPLLERAGVYPGQVPLLKALDDSDGLSQRELSSTLSIRPSTVTMTLRRMERNGLVYRRRDPFDQRVIRIYITERGRSSTREIDRIVGNMEQRVFKNFTDEEKILMKRMLIQMQNNLITEPVSGPGKDGDHA